MAITLPNTCNHGKLKIRMDWNHKRFAKYKDMVGYIYNKIYALKYILSEHNQIYILWAHAI